MNEEWNDNNISWLYSMAGSLYLYYNIYLYFIILLRTTIVVQPGEFIYDMTETKITPGYEKRQKKSILGLSTVTHH